MNKKCEIEEELKKIEQTSGMNPNCEIHNLIKQNINISGKKLACLNCYEPNNDFYPISEEILNNFFLISLQNQENDYFDIVVKRKHDGKPFIMKLFRSTLEKSQLKFLTKEFKGKFLSSHHENLQKVVFMTKLKKSKEFYILLEYFHDDLPLIPSENSRLFLRQILEGLDELHNNKGIFHGNLSIKFLKLEKNTVKICLFPCFRINSEDPEAISHNQRKDVRNFGLLIYQIASGDFFPMDNEDFLERKIQDILETLHKNNYEKIIAKCLNKDSKISIFEVKEMFKALPIEKPWLSYKMTNNSTYIPVPFYYIYKTSDDSNFLLNLEISDKRNNLETNLSSVSSDFEIFSKNLLHDNQRIPSLKVHLKPNFLLVSHDDNWRTFWWYSFYQNLKDNEKTRLKGEIVLTIKSTDDWDNGLSKESLNVVLDILKQTNFINYEFERLDLIFHSYLNVKNQEIDKITKIIESYNFSRLKHLEIVVSSEQGNQEKFLNLSNAILKRMNEVKGKLQFFSILFNCIHDMNPCVEKVGEIAKSLENLKVFRFWMGNVNKNMNVSPLNEAFSRKFLCRLNILSIGFNSWKETPFITDCNFQEMLENMRVGLSTNLKELHIWLWSCDIMELSILSLYELIKEKSLFFDNLNLYFEGWAKRIESEEKMQEDLINVLNGKSRKSGASLLKARHIKLFLKQ